MFKQHQIHVATALRQKQPETDWQQLYQQHQLQLVRIQHERLIHLIVTVFVGSVMVSTAFVVVFTSSPMMFFVFLCLLLLFLGYILHYRYLENTTQSWYVLEDEIRKRLTKKI